MLLIYRRSDKKKDKSKNSESQDVIQNKATEVKVNVEMQHISRGNNHKSELTVKCMIKI